MISGRPIKFEVTHALKQNEIPEKAVEEVSQEELDEEHKSVGMDGVLTSLQELMEVNMFDE